MTTTATSPWKTARIEVSPARWTRTLPAGLTSLMLGSFDSNFAGQVTSRSWPAL